MFQKRGQCKVCGIMTIEAFSELYGAKASWIGTAMIRLKFAHVRVWSCLKIQREECPFTAVVQDDYV